LREALRDSRIEEDMSGEAGGMAVGREKEKKRKEREGKEISISNVASDIVGQTSSRLPMRPYGADDW
jgi:hypothetical protein